MTYPIDGECQCGEVKFKILNKPEKVIACHCTECQKLATAPFSVTAVFKTDHITFEGEMSDWSRPCDDGNISAAKFCPNCGNRVYHYNPEDTSKIKLKLKPIKLHDDKLFEPSIHVWTEEKLDWYQIPEGVKIFSKQS